MSAISPLRKHPWTGEQNLGSVPPGSAAAAEPGTRQRDCAAIVAKGHGHEETPALDPQAEARVDTAIALAHVEDPELAEALKGLGRQVEGAAVLARAKPRARPWEDRD